jgi:hypothetical protein
LLEGRGRVIEVCMLVFHFLNREQWISNLI